MKKEKLYELLENGRYLTNNSGFCNMNRNYLGNFALCSDNDANQYELQYFELRTKFNSILNYDKLIIRKKDKTGGVFVFAIDYDIYRDNFYHYEPDYERFGLDNVLEEITGLKVDENMQNDFHQYDFSDINSNGMIKNNVYQMNNLKKKVA